MADDENFQLRDIPDATLKGAVFCVKPYTTAFGWNGQHIGGGTFARINGRPGILTAAHVWECIDQKRAEHPEVQIMISDEAHHYSVPVDYFIPHISFTRKSDAWGPDIQFVEVPAALVGTISARKSFAELSAHAEKYKNIASRDGGFAAIPGFPAERVTWVPEGFQGAPLVELRGGFVGGIERRITRDGFDYLETTADYRNATALPHSFGGVSGSGIWSFSLHKKPGASVETAKIGDDFALAGVAYYQETAPESRMTVRYHGPETIYSVVCRTVPTR